jgi:capsular polysaccharide export protein
LRILFFAVARFQSTYFQQLAGHLECDADVVRSKRIFTISTTALRYLFRLPLRHYVDYKMAEINAKRERPVSPVAATLARLYYGAVILYNAARYHAYLTSHPFDVLAVYNGYHLRQAIAVDIAKTLNKRILYFENGALPDTTTMDWQGINFDNALPRERAFYEARIPEVTRKPAVTLHPRAPKNSAKFAPDPHFKLPDRYIFVPFQVDHDTQLLCHSPHIADMEALYRFIEKSLTFCEDSDTVILFKEHPSALRDYSHLHSSTNSRLRFANGVSTQTLIENAEAIVTINSSVGIEALLYHKRVITLGNTFYTIDGIAENCTSPECLANRIDRLEAWHPEPSLIDAFLHYLQHSYLVPGHWKHPTKEHFDIANARLECR